MKTTNTKRKGVARTIIFKSGKTFKAVCLDFDIIEEAGTREVVEAQIKEAILGYIENIHKNKLDDKLLNRHTDKKYWDMYFEYLKVLENYEVPKKSTDISNTSIFTTPINPRATCYV